MTKENYWVSDHTATPVIEVNYTFKSSTKEV